MILNFIKRLFSTDIYVQLWENRLRLANVDTGEVFDEEPLIAIGEKDKVLGIGNEAKVFENESNCRIINPFSHPRMLVDDFATAEKVLQYSVRMLHQNKFISPSPRILFQPMDKLEGGVTPVEKRVYRELCLGAGARVVSLHIGNSLLLTDINDSLFKKLNS